MARASVQNLQSVGDPALAWNFSLSIPYMPGSADTRSLTYKCQAMTKPGTTLEVVDAALHGVNVPYASRRQYSHRITVRFLEDSSWNTRTQINNWIDIARNWVDNTGSLSSTYMVTVDCITYNDLPAVTDITRMYGLFPTELNDVQLDGSTGEIVFLEVQFAYAYTQTVSS
jgi:hypothetical protein